MKIILQEIERLEALVQSVRNQALEEAAVACADRIGTGSPGIDTFDMDSEAIECANAIRALKTEESA